MFIAGFVVIWRLWKRDWILPTIAANVEKFQVMETRLIWRLAHHFVQNYHNYRPQRPIIDIGMFLY